MPLSVRPATLADSPHIGRIGAASFADTLSLALFPPHLRHLSARGDAFLDEAEWRAARNVRRMNEGKVTFVVVDKEDDGKEEIVGFAQWVPPHEKSKEDTEKENEADVLPPTIDEGALKKLWEVIEGEIKDVLGQEGYSKMWYLMILGVDPKHYRRGIGKILVKKGLELAERDGTDAFLIATPNGQKLYESCGFEAVGEGCALGGVPHYSMRWTNPTRKV
ncbi:acyl-CoA N-acyltransferase [Podospora fimiseda]|uniref:Acyl-CoA N-acyltransferase n=1 Tax=Podospora fimiseda TaxID=252190 RepID=A0AAN7BQ15_9PEZI|nr:acyl-CoA N-acyltransferase [Podospora fimiseda]